MSSLERILVPFSGQRDAVELCLGAAEKWPDAELVLLYVRNIGFRQNFTPPVETARALAEACTRIERLVVADARQLQTRGLAAMPAEFSRALAVRTFCCVCQSSLLLVSSIVAAQLDATLLVGPREGLGADLDAAFRDFVGGLSADSVAAPPLAARETGRKLPIAAGERCALATHHRDVDLVSDEMRDRVSMWLMSWTREMEADSARSALDLDVIAL